MTTDNIFLFKEHKDYDRHTLLSNVDQDEANELIAEGKATRIDMSTYESYRQRAKDINDEFIEAERKVKDDDNPLMTDEVKAYGLDKLRKEFEEQSKELQAEYNEYADNAIEQARTRAAQATVKVTKQDEQTAKQVRDRFALKLASTGEQDTAQALSEITKEVALLTPGQKTALAGDIPALLSNIDGEETSKRALINEVQDTRNMDALALEAVKQMPASVTMEYTTTKLARGW